MSRLRFAFTRLGFAWGVSTCSDALGIRMNTEQSIPIWFFNKQRKCLSRGSSNRDGMIYTTETPNALFRCQRASRRPLRCPLSCRYRGFPPRRTPLWRLTVDDQEDPTWSEPDTSLKPGTDEDIEGSVPVIHMDLPNPLMYTSIFTTTIVAEKCKVKGILKEPTSSGSGQKVRIGDTVQAKDFRLRGRRWRKSTGYTRESEKLD
jgi:hypothetical protein